MALVEIFGNTEFVFGTFKKIEGEVKLQKLYYKTKKTEHQGDRTPFRGIPAEQSCSRYNRII